MKVPVTRRDWNLTNAGPSGPDEACEFTRPTHPTPRNQQKP